MIFTSCYQNLGELRELGWSEDDFVGISRGKFSGIKNNCESLQPSYELLKRYLWAKRNYGGLWLDDVKIEFERKFKKYLMSLDVNYWGKILDGKVLLCWEKSGEFCHRNFVRQWLNYYGYNCIELWCK